MSIQEEACALLAAATPGPWRIWENSQAETFVVGPKGVLAGSICGPTYERPNAELIARAPELLAALCDKLDEAERELRMCYVSHRELRMDTEEDEALRLKVVARLRAVLGITDDDGWQDSSIGDAAVRAEKAEGDRADLNVELQDEREAHGAAIARAQQAEAAIERVRALADWHETKADKARRYPGGAVEVMEKAAQVHDDAARRLREALNGES